MNFLSLRYFVIVADCKSISRAAEKLFVSQQNISNHMAKLEEECGAVLFERKPAFRLTYAGEQVYHAAAQLDQTYRQLETRLADIAGETSGRVIVGVTTTRAPSMLSEILPPFHAAYPDIKIQPVLDVSNNLIAMMEKGEIDVLICFNSETLNEHVHIKTIPLQTEKLCVVVPYDVMNRKYGDAMKTAVNLFSSHVIISEFQKEPFILPEQGSRIRDAADRCFRSQNFIPEILLECSNIPTIISLARKGMGIAMAFETLAVQELGESLGKENSAFVFPAMEDQIEGTIVIGYNNEHYLGHASRKFIEMAADIYKRPHFT